jgi:hypothetical protein
MKIIAIGIILLAIAIAVVPQFTDCKAAGREPLKLASGATTEMKCFWTAQAEVAVGIGLAAAGALLLFSKRRETQRNLGIAAAVLGGCAVLVPLVLIGVCANPMMRCNSTMQPALILAGTLTMVLGIAATIIAQRTPEPTIVPTA